MTVSVRARDGIVEVEFHSVPTVGELQELRETLLRIARSERSGVRVLAMIERGGLGTLDPDARRFFRDNWPTMRAAISTVALVVAGDSVAATLTRGFVRMLSTTLGRAWTVHVTRDDALRQLTPRS